jgi:hypothetical protein
VRVLVAVIVAVGLPVLLADLNDASVCHWLARRLIHRAALRLPRSERARWEEEWLRHDLDVPGRLLPLGRAVQIFFRAGSWGRMLRGAPSRSEVLKARMRAAWQQLRSRLEASQEAPAEPVPTTVEAQPAIATAVALPATVSVVDRFMRDKPAPESPRWKAGVWPSSRFRSQEDFEDWLAQRRREDEKLLAENVRRFDAWLWLQRQNNSGNTTASVREDR